MKPLRDPLLRRTLSGLLLAGLSTGCSTPYWLAGHGTDQHAFIEYWPPPEGSKELRLAVKDNIDMRGVVTTAGSEYLFKSAAPAERDASCLAIARRSNVLIVGKTNLSEFAVAPSGINDYFGTPRNPYNEFWKLIPGGSSSGSAEAVASGMADVALGTDTAGSVRVPAACCGIVGLKTTYGLVPIDGVFPIEAEHLDTVGPMGRDIAHVVEGMDLLEDGFAAKYSRAIAAKPLARNIRIGRLRLASTDPRIDLAVDRALARAGFQVVELDDQFRARWEQAKKDGNTMAAAGAWLSDRRFALKPGVTRRAKAAILLGRLVYPKQYRQALERRAEWRRTLLETFKQVDFIALPTLQSPPPIIPPKFGLALMEARMLKLQNTVPANVAGTPALAIPIPVHFEDTPVTSLQLIGPWLSEAELLNAGRLVEASRR